VVKSVMHPEDARRAIEIGADAIVVSNHGGRQLEDAPAKMECYPTWRTAVHAESIFVAGAYGPRDGIKKDRIGAHRVA